MTRDPIAPGYRHVYLEGMEEASIFVHVAVSDISGKVSITSWASHSHREDRTSPLVPTLSPSGAMAWHSLLWVPSLVCDVGYWGMLTLEPSSAISMSQGGFGNPSVLSVPVLGWDALATVSLLSWDGVPW